VFHELGDFLAACWRGFLLGEVLVRFGKLISRKKLGGYWFRLAASPPAA
jgi:membrane-associated protease RseP (regulator of RpoE activity)